jgi:hypothetical protein
MASFAGKDLKQSDVNNELLACCLAWEGYEVLLA